MGSPPASSCSARRRWCPRSGTRLRPSSSCRSWRTASSSSTSSATSSAASGEAASTSRSILPPKSTTGSPPSAATSMAGTWRHHGWRAPIYRHCSWASPGDHLPSHTRDSCTQFVMVEPLLWIGCWLLIWKMQMVSFLKMLQHPL
uniref:Uncharacterized protein n=1 Tax=Arundo donax TaxID=35708 RepID=A0A0A9G767_ARUDO